jgi:hypothetical protein
MCMCGYTPFLDRSFTPESFNTLSRASSSWTHFVKRPFNHLALCGWCSTLRVGTCSTFVGTSLGNLWFSPHFRLLLPRSLPCSALLAGTAQLCHRGASRLLLPRSLPCSAFLAGTAQLCPRGASRGFCLVEGVPSL